MAVTRLVNDAVVAAWDAVSTAYHERYDIPTHAIHLGPMVPPPADLGIDTDVTGRRVLDFGCGGGQNAIACAVGGARDVVAVDPSARQLDLARASADKAGVSVDFIQLDDSTLGGLADDFDVVLSVYALQFVPDIEAALRLLSGRLRPGGRLVVSVDHPLRVAGEWRGEDFVVEDYFAKGWQSWPYDFPEAGIRTEMSRYRRPVQDWVHAVIAAPLTLRGLYEPRPAAVADSFARHSKYGVDDPRNVFSPGRLATVPGSLILVAEKTS